MNNFTIMIIFINLLIVLIGVGFFTSNNKNTNVELEKLKLEREKFEFEKYKFDEMETNKYTYLLKKMKHELILKTMETSNLNTMNIRDNETHEKEIQAKVQERMIAMNNEKEKALSEIDASLKKTQIEAGLNFKDDILDTFDNVIRLYVETHIHKHVLQGNNPDTARPEDILIPVGTENVRQLEEIKNKIISNFGMEAIGIFDRYMKREMWQGILTDMLSVYWTKSINIAKTRKIQLAGIECATMTNNDKKPAIFINGQINTKCGLSEEMIRLIQDLKLKSKADLTKVINTINDSNITSFENSMYKPLATINLNDYR